MDHPNLPKHEWKSLYTSHHDSFLLFVIVTFNDDQRTKSWGTNIAVKINNVRVKFVIKFFITYMIIIHSFIVHLQEQL